MLVLSMLPNGARSEILSAFIFASACGNCEGSVCEVHYCQEHSTYILNCVFEFPFRKFPSGFTDSLLIGIGKR